MLDKIGNGSYGNVYQVYKKEAEDANFNFGADKESGETYNPPEQFFAVKKFK